MKILKFAVMILVFASGVVAYAGPESNDDKSRSKADVYEAKTGKKVGVARSLYVLPGTFPTEGKSAKAGDSNMNGNAESEKAVSQEGKKQAEDERGQVPASVVVGRLYMNGSLPAQVNEKAAPKFIKGQDIRPLK